MNKIETQAKSVSGKDRFEKRENLAKWLQEFLRNDPDCEGFTVKRINLPNDELMQMVFFRAYNKSYAWIDYVRDNLLDTSRLEYIDDELEAHIIFDDDFGTEPAFDLFTELASVFGVIDV